MTMHRDERLPPYHCQLHDRYLPTCEDCREARRVRDRKRERLAGYGTPPLVDAIGVKRRLAALMAIGWPMEWLAPTVGMTPNGLRELMLNQRRTTRETHRRITEMYEQFSMTFPVGSTPGERMAISRTKARAQAFGYEPPLAWDDHDIDAPFEIEVTA